MTNHMNIRLHPVQYVATNRACATACKQTSKSEVFDYMRLNVYVKSLPNFMRNDDEQLSHAAPQQ